MKESAITLPVVSEPATPLHLLQIAVEKGADIDKLTKLMDLEERWRANKAREAFVQAMAGFKAEPSRILKSRIATIQSDKGSFKYPYASLIEVVDGVVGNLSKHGFTHRWETVQEGERITVTCVLTHIAGHSERNTQSGPPDMSGKKNPIQAIASTVSYLQRYSLLAVTGLAASDMDDDGAGGSADDLMALAEKMNKVTALPELVAMMNALDPATQRSMMPTFKKRRGELGNAK